MSKGNSNNKSNNNSNGFLISKNQPSRFSARSRASLTRTLYVSLDNADKVIEGAPLLALLARGGCRTDHPARLHPHNCVHTLTQP
jgi:hypothetical protein